MPVHVLPPLSPTPLPGLPARQVTPAAILDWLGRGWSDLRRAPVPGLLHGAAFAAFAVLVLGVARGRWGVLAGAFSGFLLVAPILVTWLYLESRALAHGQPLRAADAWAVLRARARPLLGFGLLLALAGTGWVLTSSAWITLGADGPVTTVQAFVTGVVAAREGWLFESWLLLGALLAAPVYASTVVTVPLLVDRDLGVRAAVATSWRTVAENPLTLALWAAVLAALTLLGLGLGLVGIIPVVPWLAHASWHASRALVAADA